MQTDVVASEPEASVHDCEPPSHTDGSTSTGNAALASQRSSTTTASERPSWESSKPRVYRDAAARAAARLREQATERVRRTRE